MACFSFPLLCEFCNSLPAMGKLYNIPKCNGREILIAIPLLSKARFNAVTESEGILSYNYSSIAVKSLKGYKRANRLQKKKINN